MSEAPVASHSELRGPLASTLAELDEYARFAGVSKTFEDGNEVFKDLDFRLRRGELSVVIGGSGSGKSTLLRVLLGLESYDRGSVELLGREVSELSPREHTQLMMNLGMLFQFGALFDSMTVYENVGFALRHSDMKSSVFRFMKAKSTIGSHGAFSCWHGWSMSPEPKYERS